MKFEKRPIKRDWEKTQKYLVIKDGVVILTHRLNNLIEKTTFIKKNEKKNVTYISLHPYEKEKCNLYISSSLN